MNECGRIPYPVAVETILANRDSYTEAQWENTLIPWFRANGWECFHADRGQGRDGRWMTNTRQAGLPDWLLLRPPDLVIIETKRQKGRPTRDQVRIIRKLQQVRRVLAGFARPSDAATLVPIALDGIAKSTKQGE